MSFRFCSHAWEVRHMQDGTHVTLSPRDLNSEAVAVFVDELCDLVQGSGQPDLHLDLADIRQISSVVMGKLIALNTRLRERGGRLILHHVPSLIYDALLAARLHDVLDIRMQSAAETMH
jgi:anti-anti-sigma regulatory factor